MDELWQSHKPDEAFTDIEWAYLNQLPDWHRDFLIMVCDAKSIKSSIETLEAAKELEVEIGKKLYDLNDQELSNERLYGFASADHWWYLCTEEIIHGIEAGDKSLSIGLLEILLFPLLHLEINRIYISQQLKKKILNGELPIWMFGSYIDKEILNGREKIQKYNTLSIIEQENTAIHIDDLRKCQWFTKEQFEMASIIIRYFDELQKPFKPNTDEVKTLPKESASSRLELQINVLLDIRFSMPEATRKQVHDQCRKQRPDLFSIGFEGFKKVWNASNKVG